jgi:hypothetical protein
MRQGYVQASWGQVGRSIHPRLFALEWADRSTRNALPRPYVHAVFLTSLPVLAGIASTVIFASSTLPMLGKALRTHDLGSYSLGNLLLANVGNAVHSFYLASTGLMLAWFLRYELLPTRTTTKMHCSPDATQ